MTADSDSARQSITVAERLLHPETVLAAAPSIPGASLQGLAGTALLHARLATLDPVFAAAARAHWTAAATHTRRGHAGRGVFAAPGGLAASLILGENYLPDPRPHDPAVRQAARWLSAQATTQACDHSERLRYDGRAAASWALYDAITGLAGTGRILLAALQQGHPDAEPGLTAALTTLTTLINNPGSPTRPGWWLPPTGRPSTTPLPPSGVAETGMAHGIAGPLALLSTAASAGYAVTGQTTAIRTAAEWLLTWQVPDRSWPPYVSGDELDTAQPARAAGRRDAWCYGGPGISRALTLAGAALGEPHLAAAGAGALQRLTERAPHRWDVEGPSICHGFTGVLVSTRTAPATADWAARAVTTAYDNGHVLGFQHVHHGKRIDEPGLLTGAAGISLALADHAGLTAPGDGTRWDAVLLLS